MHKLFVLLFSVTVLLPVLVQANDDGLVSKQSKYSVTVTVDKLEEVLKAKGITIALRWNHSERANKINIPLRPTELLIFGNPALGSHMFTSNQKSAIDFPMKALVWEDEHGVVWLTYNDPAFFARRHQISNRDEIIKKMTGALNMFSDVATGANVK